MHNKMLRYSLYSQIRSFCSVYVWETPQGLEKWKRRGGGGGRQLWGIRFSSPEAPTIKTTYKDSSNKTPIQIEEEGTNTQVKEEKDMVRLNTNSYLRIVSDVALVLEEALKLVDSIVKKLFYRKFLPNLPLAGRPKHFHKNWELITENPDTLVLIKGFKRPFLGQPVQDYLLRIPELSKAQRELVQAEIETMLRKEALSQTGHTCRRSL